MKRMQINGVCIKYANFLSGISYLHTYIKKKIHIKYIKRKIDQVSKKIVTC